MRRAPISTLFPYTTLFRSGTARVEGFQTPDRCAFVSVLPAGRARDRKSTRLNSSHTVISYAVFCLNKKHLRAGGAGDRRTPEKTDRGLGRRLGERDHLVVDGDVVELPGGHVFFFNDTATTEIYTLSLHDALPI